MGDTGDDDDGTDSLMIFTVDDDIAYDDSNGISDCNGSSGGGTDGSARKCQVGNVAHGCILSLSLPRGTDWEWWRSMEGEDWRRKRRGWEVEVRHTKALR